ncbi:hypothetical protein ACOP1M_12560 [Staphylococcus warneri]|uniref:hypothetical protein n=1 Tax=Staphylococcus warneri TaxID=1292 RepID=UPI0034CDB7F5
MKKFIVLVSFLAILLSACSSDSPTEKAQGKWKSEDGGVELKIKKQIVKGKMKDGLEEEGYIKNVKNHKDVAKIDLGGDMYVKVKDDKLYVLEKPDDNIDDNVSIFKKVD